MKPVVYACIPLLVLNTVSAASAQNFTPDEMKANMERMFALDLPEDCPEFRESEETFNHSAMTTIEINSFISAWAICKKQRIIDEASETAEIDAVSGTDLSNIPFSALAFNSCRWPASPNEHFDWCDRLKATAPNLNEVHFRYYEKMEQDHEGQGFPFVIESLLHRVRRMPIDDASCQLDDGHAYFEVVNRDGLLVCIEPDKVTSDGFGFSNRVTARDFNHDGVMDLSFTVSAGHGGTLRASSVLVITRDAPDKPFHDITDEVFN